MAQKLRGLFLTAVFAGLGFGAIQAAATPVVNDPAACTPEQERECILWCGSQGHFGGCYNHSCFCY